MRVKGKKPPGMARLRVAGRILGVLEKERAIVGSLGRLGIEKSLSLLRRHVFDKSLLGLEVVAHLLALVVVGVLGIDGLAYQFTGRVSVGVSVGQCAVIVHGDARGAEGHVLIPDLAVTVEGGETCIRDVGGGVIGLVGHRLVEAVLLVRRVGTGRVGGGRVEGKGDVAPRRVGLEGDGGAVAQRVVDC